MKGAKFARWPANMGGADIVITDMAGTVVHNTETASSLQSNHLSAGIIEEIHKDGSYSAISTVDGLFPEALDLSRHHERSPRPSLIPPGTAPAS